MRAILSFLLLLSTTSFATDAFLTQCLKKSSQGLLQDRRDVQGLQQRLAQESDPEKRIFIAYLLSHASVSVADPRPHIDKLLASPEKAAAALGGEAVERLYRLRADLAYDNGHFDSAANDYAHVILSKNILVREYAVLKLGWCHLNQHHADKSFALWRAQWDELYKNDANRVPSPNLLEGMGQALVENRNRSVDDFAWVSTAIQTEERRELFAAGVESGWDILNAEKKDADGASAKLIEQLHTLSWYGELSKHIVGKSTARGRYACRLLPFVAEENSSVSAESFRVVESCATWAAKDTEKSHAKEREHYIALLDMAFEKLPLKNSQRRAQIAWQHSRKKFVAACQTGLIWARERKSESIFVEEIAKSCEAAPANEAARLITEARAQGMAFSSEKSPEIFVTNRLMARKEFRAAISSEMMKQTGSWESTLLPALVADRLDKKEDVTLAAKLFESYARRTKDSAEEKSWDRLLTWEVEKAVAEKRFDDARRLLDKYAPGTESEEHWKLWAYVWVKTPAKSRENSSLDKLLASPYALKDIALFAALLEGAAEANRWGLVRDALKKSESLAFDKIGSDRFRICLVQAAANGDFKTEGTERADVKFLVTVGESLGNDNALMTLKPLGKSVVNKDLASLQSLAKRKKSLLVAPAGDAQLPRHLLRSIEFINGETRQVRKRGWSSPVFYEAAERSLSEYCVAVTEQLPQLKKRIEKGSAAAQWTEFFASFEKRLGECRKHKEAAT